MGAEIEENWMKYFLINSPDPVLRVGKDGTILYSNKAGKILLETLKSQVGEIAPAEILKAARQVALRQIPAQIELRAGGRT